MILITYLHSFIFVLFSPGVVYFGGQHLFMKFLKFIKRNKDDWTDSDTYLSKIHFIVSDYSSPVTDLSELLNTHDILDHIPDQRLVLLNNSFNPFL